MSLKKTGSQGVGGDESSTATTSIQKPVKWEKLWRISSWYFYCFYIINVRIFEFGRGQQKTWKVKVWSLWYESQAVSFDDCSTLLLIS